MVSCVSSSDKSRQRNSCDVEAKKVNRIKAKNQDDYYISLFFWDVYFYFVFKFKIFDEIEKDPTNLSFKHNYYEMML